MQTDFRNFEKGLNKLHLFSENNLFLNYNFGNWGDKFFSNTFIVYTITFRSSYAGQRRRDLHWPAVPQSLPKRRTYSGFRRFAAKLRLLLPVALVSVLPAGITIVSVSPESAGISLGSSSLGVVGVSLGLLSLGVVGVSLGSFASSKASKIAGAS